MSFTPDGSRAIREAYLDLYLMAARFLEGHVKPTQVRNLRAAAENGIKKTREQLFRAGIPEEWVNEVQLPVVGLLDESARRCPTPGVADQWQSLQYPLYGHELVGRISFEHLEKLRNDPETPVEVVEVYMRVLALGYQGQYSPHRLDDLKILNEGLRNELNRRMGKLPPLSPHLGSSMGKTETPPVLKPTWIAAIALAAVLTLGMVLTIMLSLEARQAEAQLRSLITGAEDDGGSRP
ncbi:MAG: DotU family type IV/VI secretion system protein [Myxococcota bacterium]